MSRRVSQKSALALLVCFALCQPAVVVASTLSLTAVKSQPRLTGPNLRISHDSTTSRVPADRLSTETIKEKPEAESTEKTTKKKVLRSRGSKTSKKSHLKSATTARKVSHHYKYLGNREDCDACHQQCLIASLACIAISIATACPVCGGVCLVYQAACQATCNGTTACKNVSGGSGSFEETPVIINNP